MRKYILLILLAFVINVLASEYSQAAKVIDGSKESTIQAVNFDEPPFYMFTYDEFADLQSFQKDFYLEKFRVALAQVPALQNTTKENMKEAAEWADSWKQMQTKLYQFCGEKDSQKVCDDISDIRIQALDMFALHQSKADRQAASIEAEAKKKKQETKTQGLAQPPSL